MMTRLVVKMKLLINQPEVHLLKPVRLVGQKQLRLHQGVHRREPHLHLC